MDSKTNLFLLSSPIFDIFNKNSSVFWEIDLPVAVLNKYRGFVYSKGVHIRFDHIQYLIQTDIVVFDIVRYESVIWHLLFLSCLIR